jgi:hypothetical protein
MSIRKEMSDEDKQDLLDHVEKLKAKGRRRFRFVLGGVSLGTLAVFFVMLAQMQPTEDADRSPASLKEEPPKTATEIIAQEFSGEIQKGYEPPLGAADVKPMIPRNDPSLPDLDEEEEKNDDKNKEAATAPAKSVAAKSARKPASTPVVAAAAKSTSLKFTLDKSAVKVSKNLDKKKVVSYLGDKLNKANCWPSELAKAKSVKAVINISKTGSLGKIQVTPSESKIASCLKQKLGPSAKVFKTKNKAVAEITLHLKVSR